MNEELKKIAELLKQGIGELEYAQVDHHRTQRCGFPEVIYGAGKTAAQIVGIVAELKKHDRPLLCTRISPEKAAQVMEVHAGLEYCELSQTLMCRSAATPPVDLLVTVITAGTSDMNVALEAQHTLELCGIKVVAVNDVGVAGLHRLLARIDELTQSDVIIAVAGMEGALPSVIAGLVSCPVIAVPTSVGYGVSLGGFSALAGMLSSCASGLTVVNIDNGFGAACAAIRMASLRRV